MASMSPTSLTKGIKAWKFCQPDKMADQERVVRMARRLATAEKALSMRASKPSLGQGLIRVGVTACPVRQKRVTYGNERKTK